MKIVAIIQARMGSTRLPGKVLQEIAGCTMLELVVRRTQQAKLIDAVVVATTVDPSDDAIIAECERLNVSTFRGSEHDVLDRYYGAAQFYNADVVVRITSDCPLIDPTVIDHSITTFKNAVPNVDYASNGMERTYPRGLDTEVMTMAALKNAWENAIEMYQRSHVTPYLYQNGDKFSLLPVIHSIDYSGWRWTVDTPDDLAFVRELYRRLDNDRAVHWLSAIELMQTHPELAEINRHIQQKSLHEG